MKGFWRRFCNRMKADWVLASMVVGVSCCFVVGILGMIFKVLVAVSCDNLFMLSHLIHFVNTYF